MDKVFSARLDEAAIEELSRGAKRLGMTKKEFLESAIRLRAREVDRTSGTDIWAETSGIWARDEAVDETRRESRAAFEESFQRHHRRRRSPRAR